MTTPSAGGPLPLKPGESPAAQSIEEAEWQIMMCLAAGNHEAARRALKDFGDRRGEEERAKALEEAAGVCDLHAEELPPHTEARRLTASNLAHAIRSLAAAPSGDAKGTK